MRAQWMCYPSNADSYTSIRVLVPSLEERPVYNRESFFLSEGKKSKIGNRSCLHMKIESNVIPLPHSYDVKPLSSKYYYNLVWTATGLPASRWTALLATTPRQRTYFVDYGTYTIERWVSTTDIQPGSATVITESYTRYKDDPIKDVANISTYTFKSRGYPYNRADVTRSIKTLNSGVWTESTVTSATPCGYVEVNATPFRIDADAFWRLHGREIVWRANHLLPVESWGKLANDCVTKGDKAYQTNSAMYLMELTNLSSLLSPYLELMRKGMSAKAAANAWLSYYYGARLTVKDTYAQISGIVRRSQLRIMDVSTLRSRSTGSITLPDGTTISGYRALTVYYQSHCNWIVDTWRTLRRYGLNPSLSLAWDLVPLSFVVDWLAPIGDALEYFDGKTFQQSLSIVESLQTNKYIQKSDAALLGFPGYAGDVVITYYERHLVKGVMPRATFEPDPISFSGMKALNGSALVVQRRP